MFRWLFIVCFALISNEVLAKKFNGFDVSNSLVARKNIVHGGPPRDGIPSIDDPHYVNAKQAIFLQPKDFVLGFEYQGQAFAFPRYIMNWHEIVNGTVNDHAFMVSYCPLCGTGMAFSSEVDGQSLEFGVSGLLYNSDVIFYDRQTESLWSQIDRRAIAGVYAGKELKQLPMTPTTWERWVQDHPETRVLSENQGVKRNYRHDPYSGYETSSRLFFKTLRKAPKEFHTKERVLGIEVGGVTKAYPFVELRKYGREDFEDKIGDRAVRVRWDEENETATVETLSGEIMTSTIAFWFAWYTFHPETEVFRNR